MSKKYPDRLVLRTPLITAGHKLNYIQKAMASEADAIILDVEDGVPLPYKQQAREVIHEYLNNDICAKRLVFVRVNSLETGMTKQDIDEVSHPNLDGFVLTKIYNAGEVQLIDKMLAAREHALGLEINHFSVIVITETPASVLNAQEIAFAAPRVRGLLFGAEDLLSDMEGMHAIDERSIQPARSQVLMAARAAGIMPIDTPYIYVNDPEGQRRFSMPAVELGYEGMLLISPSQIDIVREMYTPAKDKVEEAYEMIRIAKESEQAQQGVAIAGKHFISPPTLKRAVNLVVRYEAIQRFVEYTKSYQQT